VHTCEDDGGAFELDGGVERGPVDDVVVDESPAVESVVVEVVLDDVLAEDGMVVDVDEDDEAIAVVGVDDEDVDESNNITDGGDSDDVESVAKTGDMATSPTNPTAEATSERRYMDTPLCRLPDRSRPGHHRAGAGTGCEGEPRNTNPRAQEPQN
jgi:hypothetical protein